MDNTDTPTEPVKLTKGQKKKLKEKAKKEAAAKAAAEAAASGKAPEEAKATPAPAAGGAKGKGKKGKGKKGPGSAAAKLIKQQLQEQRAAQEEQEKEEERLRQEAINIQKKKEEEERKIKEEADRIEQERIDKIRQLKKEGKWLSKKERAKKEAQEEARRQLIAQGLVDEDAFNTKEGDQKPKVIYSNKRRKKGKKGQNNKNQEKKENTEEVAQEEEKKEEEPKHSVQPGLEEDPAEIKKQTEQVATKEVDEELVVDDWEDLEDDNIIEDQVKLQEEVAPVEKVQVEEMPDSEELNSKPEVKAPKAKEEAKAPKTEKKGKKKEEKKYGGRSIFERRVAKKRHHKKKAVVKEEFKNESEELRCPIICVLGHVDTGKTLLLDKIRRTNVQRGEAGGITQQIGATYFPGEALQKNLDKIGEDFDVKKVEIPGLLVIDTPGHESFTNLRSRGSNLCDLAVLVVDVMHGLEQQTLESIDLLRKRKTPFIVALNKIDRCHDWKDEEYRSSRASINIQEQQVINEYENRRDQAFLQFNELGLNIIEYWNNEDPRSFISAVPTSAMTGEGIPDLLGMVVKCTQKMLRKNIIQKNNEFQCTVLEVKKIPGVGTTVDIVLVNGEIHVGDTIVLAGFNGPIVTKIRALLTPQPMKEIRVKGDYVHHEVLYGAMGIKISAPDLDYALAGGELYRATSEDQVDDLCDEISENMFNFAEKYVNPSEEGVCVQASTLGSLEALLEFLKTSNIPVCSVNIGSIFKKDVMKALKAISGEKTNKEFATILAFDVKIDNEARDYAEENGIKIFEADIIYHLFDQFTAYVAECEEQRKENEGDSAVFPWVLEIIKDNIFHTSDPMLLGMNVLGGVLKVGTPLCCPDKGNLKIGVVTGIQKNKKDVNEARPIDGGVSVKINNKSSVQAGKSFTEANQLCSLITRNSIDSLKAYFKDEMTKADWKLVIRLKDILEID